MDGGGESGHVSPRTLCPLCPGLPSTFRFSPLAAAHSHGSPAFLFRSCDTPSLPTPTPRSSPPLPVRMNTHPPASPPLQWTFSNRQLVNKRRENSAWRGRLEIIRGGDEANDRLEQSRVSSVGAPVVVVGGGGEGDTGLPRWHRECNFRPEPDAAPLSPTPYGHKL